MSALDKGLCLVLLSQTGPVPQVALRPLLEGGRGSEHWNSRAQERRVSRSAGQGRVLRKELMVIALCRIHSELDVQRHLCDLKEGGQVSLRCRWKMATGTRRQGEDSLRLEAL